MKHSTTTGFDVKPSNEFIAYQAEVTHLFYSMHEARGYDQLR
jgi:hypothetical protein